MKSKIDQACNAPLLNCGKGFRFFHYLKNSAMPKKQTILGIALTACCILATMALQAQPGGGGGGQGMGGPAPGSGAAPIDGGAILLALGAAAYGRQRLKAQQEN